MYSLHAFESIDARMIVSNLTVAPNICENSEFADLDHYARWDGFVSNLTVAPNIVLAGSPSRAILTVFLDLGGPEHVIACPI